MKDNKYLKEIQKAKTLDRLNKISNHIGVSIGRIKDINKAKAKLIKALEKEQKQVKKDYAKIQENLKVKRQEKENSRLYNRVKSAEKQFKNSFKYLSELEKEVFLKNKTASFSDKFQIGSPLTFYDFKNKKEFVYIQAPLS